MILTQADTLLQLGSPRDQYWATCYAIILDDVIENTLADHAKLCGEVDMLEGRTLLEGDLNRMEECDINNCITFNRDKCKALFLGCLIQEHSTG